MSNAVRKNFLNMFEQVWDMFCRLLQVLLNTDYVEVLHAGRCSRRLAGTNLASFFGWFVGHVWP